MTVRRGARRRVNDLPVQSAASGSWVRFALPRHQPFASGGPDLCLSLPVLRRNLGRSKTVLPRMVFASFSDCGRLLPIPIALDVHTLHSVTVQVGRRASQEDPVIGVVAHATHGGHLVEVVGQDWGGEDRRPRLVGADGIGDFGDGCGSAGVP